MLPRKTGKPIAFKCTEELRQQTEAIADSLGKSLSDYVRKAVEEYNKKFPHFDSTHKNNTLNSNMITSEMKLENLQAFVDKINKQQTSPKNKPENNTVSKPRADSTIEKGFKKIEGNDYFKPCPKGGK